MRFVARLLLIHAFFVAVQTGWAGEKKPRVLKHEGWVGAVSFSPDSKTLASAGSDKVVRLWDAATGNPRLVLRGYDDTITSIAFSGDRHIITGSFRHPALFRDFDTQPMNVKERPADLAVAAHAMRALLAMGSIDGTVRVRSVTGSTTHILKGHKTWVNCLAFNPDGSLLASASSDGTVRLWAVDALDKIGGRELAVLQGGAGEVRSVVFSPNGKLLAAGNRYGTVRIWDAGNRQVLKTLSGHAGDVWAVAFSPDGKTLASVDTDWKKPSRIRLWETSTWRDAGSLACPGEILCLAFSPDGAWLAAGCWDQAVRVFAMQ